MSDPFPADPFPALALPRLLLRCVWAGDAAATAGLMTPAVSRWIAHWPVPFTPAMALARIERAREQAGAGLSLPMALLRRSDGALLGWVTVDRRRADPRRASLGYWLGEAHRGRGYMAEAAPAAVAAGFRLLDAAAIEAAVRPDNPASIAVLRRLGMRCVGERPVYASARGRDELCLAYELARAGA